jgi:predicted nucleic acid-binding protein
VIGSLGVVLRSKRNRHIDHARPLIQNLIGAGMFVDDEFLDDVLRSVGE